MHVYRAIRSGSSDLDGGIDLTMTCAANFSIPGGFEDGMPAIAEWFGKHPPGDA
jgi:hypothetical protein